MLDPLLISTIEDMMNKAKYPENLVFGVCIQDTPKRIEEFEEKYKGKSNVKYIPIKPEESKGCCWARAKVQTLMDDEEYFFQCDSHHRYIENWDEVTKEMFIQCQGLSDKEEVVLSTYATPCNLPEFKLTHNDGPFYMRCEKFYSIPKVRYVPENIKDLRIPGLWHTISAHFLFAKMTWAVEIPYDELLYFDGEEDTLALRSWTSGYDIYYPNKTISYHFYTRKGEKRHSDVDKFWWKIHDSSMKRVEDILSGKLKDKYGLGKVRTLQEYADFSKVDYIKRVILIPETHYFNKTKFVKLGLDWTENDNYKFKELEDGDEFYLIYDINRKMYAKLNKKDRSFSISHDLMEWNTLGGPSKLKPNDVLLTYGETYFEYKDANKIWYEKSHVDNRSFEFKEEKNEKEYYVIKDEVRNIILKLYKDQRTYEAAWKPEYKFIALYGEQKTINEERKTINEAQKTSYTEKNNIIECYNFGFSTFTKENEIKWKEYCSNKNKSYILKELLNNRDFIILQDKQRKIIMRINKNLKSLDIQTELNSWTQMYLNGSTGNIQNTNTKVVNTDTKVVNNEVQKLNQQLQLQQHQMQLQQQQIKQQMQQIHELQQQQQIHLQRQTMEIKKPQQPLQQPLQQQPKINKINKMNVPPPPIIAPIVKRNKSFETVRHTNVAIICVGNSDRIYNDFVTLNHQRYAKYFKYSYYYYDNEPEYNSSYIQDVNGRKRYDFVLFITGKTIFTKFEKITEVFKKSTNSCIGTSFDGITLNKNVLLCNTTEKLFDETLLSLNESQVYNINKPDGIDIFPNGTLSSNYQNHSRKCIVMVMNSMNESKIYETVCIWNRRLKIN